MHWKVGGMAKHHVRIVSKGGWWTPEVFSACKSGSHIRVVSGGSWGAPEGFSTRKDVLKHVVHVESCSRQRGGYGTHSRRRRGCRTHRACRNLAQWAGHGVRHVRSCYTRRGQVWWGMMGLVAPFHCLGRV